MNGLVQFQKPMAAFPGLERFARQVALPSSAVRLHLYVAGEPHRPGVVLLHGLGDEADTWRFVIPQLEGTHYLIAPDLPGFGRSDKPRQPYTMDFFLEVLAELFQTMNLNQVILAGHSMGAMIAHAFALTHPERVKRLILISGSLVARAAKFDWGTLLFLIPGLGEWMYNRLRKDPQAAYRSLKPYYRDLENLPQTERDFLFERVNQRVWSDGQRDAFLSCLRNLARWLPAQQKQLPARLATFNVPTMVLWGEADRISDIANARALLELQTSARLVIIPQAGHNVHQERPQAVLAALTEHSG